MTYRQIGNILIGLCICITFQGLSQGHTDLKVLFENAQTLSGKGKPAEAIGLYKEIIDSAIDIGDTTLLYEALYNKANLHLFLNQQDSVFEVYEKGIEISRSRGLIYRELEFHMFKAQFYKMRGERDRAYQLFREILPRLEISPRQYSIAIQEIASLKYFLHNDIDSARLYTDSAVTLSHRLQDSLRISSALEAKGELDYLTGSYLSAIDANLEAIKYTTSKTALQKFQLLKLTGQIFREIDEPEKAFYYGDQALDFADKRGYKRSVASAQNFLGILALEANEFERALDWFLKAEAFYDTRRMINDRVSVKCNIAAALLSQANTSTADVKLDEVKSSISKADKIYQSRYYRLRGKSALLTGNYSGSFPLLHNALELARETRSPADETQALLLLKAAYLGIKNYEKALEMSELHHTLQDSIFNLKQSQLLFDTEARYQKAEQDKTIAQLNAENEIKDVKLALRKRQLALGGIALIGVGGVALLIFRSARIRKKNNALLAEKNAIIGKALEEKELLLREIHHRVKNNLQVVSSLLSLQSQFVEDATAQEAIKEGRDRVKSMALIHQNLYQEDNLTGIQIKAYFEKLINGLFHSYNIAPDLIHLEQEIQELNLDVDTVIPLGLIVNELVSNALKYAFPDARKGKIMVSLKEEENTLILEVSDTGIGMQADWTREESESFGYRLIHAFKNKLEADLEVKIHGGTAVTMMIKDYKRA